MHSGNRSSPQVKLTSPMYAASWSSSATVAFCNSPPAVLEGGVGSRGLKKSGRPSQSCRVYFSVPDPRLGFHWRYFSKVAPIGVPY